MEQKSTKVDWLDRTKAILILLVVLGHVAGMAMHQAIGLERIVWFNVYRFIYGFHMPAFFFLAGMTLHGMPLLEFVKKKSFRLLVPYFVFGFISIVLYYAMIGCFSVGQATDAYYKEAGQPLIWQSLATLIYGAVFPGTDSGFRCNSVLWFLPAVFSTTLVGMSLLRGLSRLKNGVLYEIMVIPLFLLGYVAIRRSGCPNLPYGFLEVFKYLPFIFAGHLLGNVRTSGSPLSRCSAGCLMLFLLAYVIGYAYVPFHNDLTCSFVKWLIFSGAALLATLGTIGLARLVALPLLGKIGAVSIGIMLVHKWFILALNRVGCKKGLVVFVLASALSFALTLAIRHWAPWALGERRAKLTRK